MDISTMRKNKSFPPAAKRRTGFGLLATAIGTATLCASLHAEDLSRIYALARQNDPTLASADANRLATKEVSPQALAPLLPQIGGSYGYERQDANTNSVAAENISSDPLNPQYQIFPSDAISRSRSRQAEITLNQSIFNWGNIERLRSANATSESADYTYDFYSQDLLVRTATAYFGVLTAEDQLLFTQLNEKSLQKQLDQAEEKFKVGLSAITDVHVARAQHDAAVAQVITAQNAVETARESVVQIIGKNFGELNKLRDPVPLTKPEPADMQAWVDLAAKQSPTLLAAQKSVDAAEHTISANRAGHYPTLTGSISRSSAPGWGTSATNVPGYYNSGALPSNSTTGTTTIGVTLNIPIFSGGLVSSQTRQAIYQRDYAQDQLELSRRTVNANTRNAYRAVISGISEVEAAKAAVVSAQSAVDATQAGYEVGTKTILDVLTSQSQLLQAQSTYSQARHQFVLNGLALKEAAGVMTGKDLDAVNALLLQ